MINHEACQWKGNNFSEIYEWLITNSLSLNLRLKILNPEKENSSIKISIDKINLTLTVGDWIFKENEIYYVKKNNLI